MRYNRVKGTERGEATAEPLSLYDTLRDMYGELIRIMENEEWHHTAPGSARGKIYDHVVGILEVYADDLEYVV